MKKRLFPIPTELSIPGPISITKSITTHTSVRADLVGGLDMPTLRRADIHITPLTASLAIRFGGKGAQVTISPPPLDLKNCIIIKATYFDGKTETTRYFQDALDLTDEKWGELLTIVAGLNIKSGLFITIVSSWPPMSGLGGSGSLRAGLLKGILDLRHQQFNEPKATPEYVVKWAHRLDEIYTRDPDPNDVFSAMVPSGITYWGYNGKLKHFPLAQNFLSRIQECLIIAYTQEPRFSHVQDDIFKKSYLTGSKWDTWQELGKNSEILCQAIVEENMEDIASRLSKQTSLLEDLSPGFVSEKHRKLWNIAQKLNVGFKTLGSGRGGCCMAIAPSQQLALELRRLWQKEPDISLLDAHIAQ